MDSIGDALCWLRASELTAAYGSGELSPVEVAQAHLARIRTNDALLGAYVCTLATDALASAREAEARYRRKAPLGPLDGIPLGLKDNIDVAGAPTSGGSPAMPRAPVAKDATVVGRLRSAGAVLIGKHSLFELAAGGGPRIELGFPTARNPWNLDRVPGGSSSGSAVAVAAGLAPAALGTDSGGSIRFPASLCGVVGVKPTAGSLPLSGILPLSWSLDQVGPIARNIRDARTVLRVMFGTRAVARSKDRNLGSLRGKRIGVPERVITSITEMETDTLAAFRQALALLEGAGARVIPIEIPELRYAAVIGRVILSREASALYGPLAREKPAVFGSRFLFVLFQGALLSDDDYVRAQQGRVRLRNAIDEAMASLDVIATPTSPVAAWPMADELGARYVRATPNRHLLTFVFNLTGHPAVSIPCGFSEHGLPIGLQLAGQRGADDALLATAEAFETLRPSPTGPPCPQINGDLNLPRESRARASRSGVPVGERRARRRARSVLQKGARAKAAE